MNSTSKTVLVVGSSGAIGNALSKALRNQGYKVWTLSRSQSDSKQHLTVDLTKASSISKIKQRCGEAKLRFDAVFHCSGLLHDESHQPERQLRDIQGDWLMRSVEVNLLSHIHLAQAIEAFINQEDDFKWISLSAMVGSIADNDLGGWYSYRITKAGLNMFIKGLSIEWKRKIKDSCIVAIHPGTTDSPMSKPFKVRADKLYSAELSASRILKVYEDLRAAQTGQFLNWDGQRLPW